MVDYILVNDMGTTGNKAVIVDEELNLIASSTESYETFYPKRNWATQKLNEVWGAVVKSTREVIEKSKISPGDITVISFSNQMMTSVPVDKEGDPLIDEVGIWCDARSAKQAKRLCDELGGVDEYYKITGCGWQPEIANISKDMWLKENWPEVYEKTYKFLQYNEWVAQRLTGEFGTEYGNMSMTGRMDCSKREISEEIFEISGLDVSKVPELYESHDIIGEVTEEAAETMGLEEGTPVALGTGDAVCTGFGAGVVKKGLAYIYIGSANWGGVYSEEPSLDPDNKFNCNQMMPEKGYSPVQVTAAGGIVQDWVKDGMYSVEEYIYENVLDSSTFEKLKSAAAEVPPSANGLIFLPYLRGGGAPHFDINVRGAYLGLDMSHKKADMLRAAYEGVAFNCRWLFDRLEKAGNTIYDLDRVRAIGGGVMNELWMQIYADVTGVNFGVLENPRQATAKGAAIIAGVGAGIWDDYEDATKYINIAEEYEPNPENQALYDDIYETYRDSFQVLYDSNVFSRLGSGDQIRQG